jgi:hypothetical protein
MSYDELDGADAELRDACDAHTNDEPHDDACAAERPFRLPRDDVDADGYPSARPYGGAWAAPASPEPPRDACADAEPHDERHDADADGEPLRRDARRDDASSDGYPFLRPCGDGSVVPSSPLRAPCDADGDGELRREQLREHADADAAGRQRGQRHDDGDDEGLRRELRRGPCVACAEQRQTA